MRMMRGNRKVACGALAISLISGILGLAYLITLGVKESGLTEVTGMPFSEAFPALGALAAVMVFSTLIMILALPKKKR